MRGWWVLSYRAGKVKPQMFWGVCIVQYSTSAVCVCFSVTVSQSNSSLKKHRNRSIFSPFFCCFRDYNVEPPATNKTCSLPPPAEENSSPPKVRPCLFLYNDCENLDWTQFRSSSEKRLEVRKMFSLSLTKVTFFPCLRAAPKCSLCACCSHVHTAKFSSCSELREPVVMFTIQF